MDLRNLVKQMTIDEKIGQLVQYNANLFADSNVDITGPMMQIGLTKDHLINVGSVLNFADANEMRAVQDKHLSEDRNKIPMLFMMDVIHGYRTIYPIPLALGCSFDTELVEECSQMAAREASADGVHVTFTPMVDYVRDARWGRVMESCGEEPMLNSRMGAAQVRAFRGDDLRNPDRIATCVKHFAAYGGAEAGRDYNTVELSEHVLREYYLPAYKACIDAGVDMLMPSFNSLNGVPATANEWLMKQILKDEWNFEGVVISDYAAIHELCNHGVAANEKEAAKLAFSCGCDIEMCSGAYINHLKELIEEGIFTEQQLDEAVLRVLKLKEKLGLFEDPYHGASADKAAAVSLTPENRDLVKKAAAECAVLLKNDGVLPFDAHVGKVALIGPFASEKRINGMWSCKGDAEETVSVAEGVQALLPNVRIVSVRGCGNEWNDNDRSGFAEAIDAAKNADAVILCLGEPQDYSGEGNCRTDIRLPGVQMELAKQIVQINPNTAVLLFNGRPLAIPELDEFAPAILEMWFPGTEGGTAAAELLFGKCNPCGKLSMTFPKTVGQCPIYYNHPSTGRPKPAKLDSKRMLFTSNYIDCGNLPLYSFGHGLSYSNFVYEDLKLDKVSMTKDGAIRCAVTVYNDSQLPGKETVQLYMRDLAASTVRPVQQLIGFEKIYLGAGERKTVTFTVTEPTLRFWNHKNQFVSECGEFELSTGYADHLLYTTRFSLD